MIFEMKIFKLVFKIILKNKQFFKIYSRLKYIRNKLC